MRYGMQTHTYKVELLMFVLSDFCMLVYLGAVEWKLRGSPVDLPEVTWDGSKGPDFYGMAVVNPAAIIRITDCS